jgi:hypothetical protein
MANPAKLSVADWITDGPTFEELLANIRECVGLALEDVDTVADRPASTSPKGSWSLISTPTDFTGKS